MGTRENKIECYLNDEFTRRGGFTRKWKSPGRNGVPDRICIFKGYIWFIEIKTTDGINDKRQTREQKKLIDAGCMVRVVYGMSGVNGLMKEVDNVKNSILK